MNIRKVSLLLFCLLFSIFFLNACKENLSGRKNTIAAQGKKIVLPDSLVLYNPFNNNLDTSKIYHSPLKIYSFVDVSCPSCLSNIKNWNKASAELKKYKVSIILICQSEDKYELLKYLCEKKDIPEFPFPFFFDIKKEFFKRNKFLSPEPDQHTVLTDANNKVLLSGDLTFSDEVKKIYIDSIKAYVDHKKFSLLKSNLSKK